MKRWVMLLIILFCGAGCAIPLQTQGTVDSVTWSTTDFDFRSEHTFDGEADHFDFTLVIEDGGGRALTITSIAWEVWQRGVDLSGRKKRTGSWLLPAQGILQQPFEYRIVCPPSSHCPDTGLTMQWEITIEGKDAQNQPVIMVLKPELAWTASPSTEHANSDRLARQPVVLRPIQVHVPRLYYPLVDR